MSDDDDDDEEAVRVATDSIYILKTALYKIEGIEAYMAPKPVTVGGNIATHA